ncbi:MAG TPA: hypothetical protein VN253_19860 [Kofleriaceae bacterium]|nr:hypothetical protein [Kofleriaceae bacterium]
MRRELEVPLTRPVRQDAQDLLQVLVRIEGVQAAGGDDAEDRRRGLGVQVAAVEQPVLAADDRCGVIVRSRSLWPVSRPS